MRISIIDSYSYKNFHEIFNASFLVECLLITNNVRYYSCTSALRAIKYLINKNYLRNVNFITIPVIENDSKICILLRYILSTIINCFLLLKENNNTILIFNNNNIFSLYLINILNKLIKKNIIILCHGEFEIFNNIKKNNQHVFWKIYNILLKIFFTNFNNILNKNIIFLVLGDNIKNNLKKHINKNIFTNIYSIDHSYINKSYQAYKKKKNEIPIKFGIIGFIHQGKNLTQAVLLAKKLSKEILAKKIKIFSTDISNELISAGIIVPSKKKAFSREEYDKKIIELDYILFFYNKDMYKYTASGPFFDALFMEKPIIALKNNYFEYMFKKYGEFGILLDSIEEIAILIIELIKGKEFPIFNFKNIQKKILPENNKKQLINVLEEAGYNL